MSDRIRAQDYDIDAVRAEYVGRSRGGSTSDFPVEYDPIIRHCHMTGDTNPLFLDPRAAADGPYGEVVVPPSMLPVYFAGGKPWPPRPRPPSSGPARPNFSFGVPTPGDRGINMSVEYDFLEPIRVGDTLRIESRIADIFQKSVSVDPAAVWIVAEAVISNQHDTVVCRWRNTVLVHRSPDQIAADEEAL